MLATSSVAAPGVAAHVAAVPVSVAPGAITLAPPASALTGPNITYPVYATTATWYPLNTNTSAWTQADKGYPSQSYWKESSDLQIGKCDFAGCNNVQVARSFIRFPIPSQLTSTSVVHDADLYMGNVWSADGCTATAAQLWTTDAISSSTNWSNQPSWNTEMQQQSFAFGTSGCGSGENDVTWHSSELTSIMQRDAANNYITQTFGIRAADETNDLQWKQFHNGTNGYIHLKVTYNDPPNKPTARSSSPGGPCKFSASDAPTIGNDDVTLYATASDDDNDNSLATKFYLAGASGTVVHTATDTVGNNQAAQTVITRADFQNYSNNDGKEHTYHWYAISTDDAGLSSPAPADDCYFTYNPATPAAPTVTAPASGQLGQQAAVSFAAPPGACPGNACPVQYTYQLGATAPVTVTADASGNWSGNITITRAGPMVLTVTGIAAGGNPGDAATPQIDGLPPTTPYTDGDVNGDGQPDLLTPGTSGKPSLWLSPGTGTGAIGNAADIGGAGTGISPGTDGPADWTASTVLHGDFTGNQIQDVMAYYPSGSHAGSGQIIGGNGHLYGEWWNGSATSPAISTTPADDGLWHHATLTAYATSQTLYLDNQPGTQASGSIDISGQGNNLTFGAGYTGGNWPSEPHHNQTAAPDYFNGDIAAITYSYPGGP